MKPTAIFIGYQESSEKMLFEPFALFNVIGGKRDGSTVSSVTLDELGIEIPSYPKYSEWRKSQ